MNKISLLTTLSACLGLNLFTLGTVHASYGDCCTPYWDEVTPYIGIDYYQVWMGARNNWAHLINRTYPGASIYVGARFCDGFGVEFGGLWSVREAKNTAITSFFGNPVPPGMIVSTTIRRGGGYADFIGYVPIADCLEVTGHVGYGIVSPKVTFATNQIVSPPINSALLSVRGKSRGVFRLGVGLLYMVSEMVGIRGKIGWEGTSQLHLDGNPFFYRLGLDPKGFKGSTTLQAGIFIKF